MDVEYWHWLVLGMILVAAEMVVPSFTLLWFGAAAVLTGLLVAIMPLSLTLQILIWTILSVLLTFLWFKYLKPLSIDKTKAGLPDESILGETGLVIKLPNQEHRGMMRFTTPKLGSEEWPIICESELKLGDRVRVTAVSGNALVVVAS